MLLPFLLHRKGYLFCWRSHFSLCVCVCVCLCLGRLRFRLVSSRLVCSLQTHWTMSSYTKRNEPMWGEKNVIWFALRFDKGADKPTIKCVSVQGLRVSNICMFVCQMRARICLHVCECRCGRYQSICSFVCVCVRTRMYKFVRSFVLLVHLFLFLSSLPSRRLFFFILFVLLSFQSLYWLSCWSVGSCVYMRACVRACVYVVCYSLISIHSLLATLFI